jgi:hypothetical protein
MTAKKINSADPASISTMLQNFNHFHDASLIKVEFAKERQYDESGDLVYPFADISANVLCNINLVFLHNNYQSAHTKQIVTCRCLNVSRFSFNQDSYDYSDIYKTDCRSINGLIELELKCSPAKILFFTIICKNIEFSESL